MANSSRNSTSGWIIIEKISQGSRTGYLSWKKLSSTFSCILAITTKTVERIEKRADETHKSRRDVIMLLHGAGISAVIGLIGKWIEINIFKDQGRGK
jgi:hypothetical protein